MKSALVYSLAAAQLVAAFDTRRVEDVPRFLQCDPKWGNDQMGVKGPGEQATICREGCAMTSLTMALNGLGLYINDTQLDPGVMNSWLQANDGYTCAGGDCNNLVLDAPERIPGSPLVFLGEKEKPSMEVLTEYANSDREVILAHVRNSSHFVYVRPSDQGSKGVFNVLDPNFNVSTYEYDDISDIIHYHVERVDGAMDYPTFKQCDSRWGDNVMGQNNETVCQVGCLMSSISEALNGHNITISDHESNPETLNQFLRTHRGGYVGNTSSLEESVVPLVNPTHVTWPSDGMHVTNDLSPATIAEYIGAPSTNGDVAKHRVVIANVLEGGHFVLVQGLGGKNRSSMKSSVFVHDSGFARGIYSFDEVVGWRIYDMVAVE